LPSSSRSALQRSTAAPTASICTRRSRARQARPSSASICCRPGREAPCYSDRERAALGWTEALTRLCEEHAHVAAYEALKAHFSPEEQVKLTLLINVINGWNRIAVGFGGFIDPQVVKASMANVA
jgi:alkylhydroperoxidase family enzyme